jgi:hypothetical protein
MSFVYDYENIVLSATPRIKTIQENMSNDDVPDWHQPDAKEDTKKTLDDIAHLSKNLPPELVSAMCLRVAALIIKDDYALKKASVSRRHGQFGKSKSAEKLGKMLLLDKELRTVSRQYYAAVEKFVEADRRVQTAIESYTTRPEHSGDLPSEKVDHRRRPRPAATTCDEEIPTPKTQPIITCEQPQPDSLAELE